MVVYSGGGGTDRRVRDTSKSGANWRSDGLPWHSKTSVTKSARSPVSVKFDVPTASVGEPVPYVLGRRRVTRPNVLWYGNPQAIYESVTEQISEETVEYYGGGTNAVYKETKTKTTTYVVGYNIDIMMGICLGPDVVLKAIYVDNEQVWSGTAGPARTVVTLGASETAFSGAEMIFHGGAFDQVPDPVMSAVPDMNGYVGICYAIFRNMRADKYMGAIHFEVERFVNPLGLTTAQNRNGNDISVMTALYEVAVNEWGGAGLEDTIIDTANFAAAAERLRTEGNFCSVLLDQTTSAQLVISELQSQVQGIVYQSPVSGKLKIILVRPDTVNLTTVTSFNEVDIIAPRNFTKEGWSSTVEQMRGVYPDRADNYEPNEVYAQVIANASATRRTKRSAVNNYPYVCRSDVALGCLSRDLTRMVQPLFSMDLEITRKAADLEPGTVILVTVPEYELYGVPLVATKVRKQPNKIGTVVVSAMQYVMPQNQATFDAPALPFDPGISFDPASPSEAIIQSAPFYLARTAGLVDVLTSTRLIAPMVMPVIANPIQAFWKAAISNVPSVGRADIVDGANYATFGELSVDMSKYDSWTTGLIPFVLIDSVVNPANLLDVGATGAKEGRVFAIIDNEIITFESCDDLGAGQWQLNNVRRGLMDTVAADHLTGARVIILTNVTGYIPSSEFVYPLTYAPNFRIWSGTPNKEGRYADALSTSPWVANSSRTMSPPRPHDTKIDGVRNSTAVQLNLGATTTISWKTRIRSSINIKHQTEAAEIGEITDGGYQRHRVMLRDANGVDHDCGLTPAGAHANSLVATIPTGAALGTGQLWVRAEIILPYGTETSVFRDWLPVEILSNAMILTEDGASYLVTETNNPIIQEAA